MRPTRQTPPGRPPASRGNPATGDIVRSVLLLAVVLLAVTWVGGWFRSDTVVEPTPVDYAAVARQAAAAAPYPLLVPSTLPAGWRATQARWDPADEHWHLGLLTADDAYVGVEQQSSEPIGDLVETYAAGSDLGDDIDVGGVRWQVYADTERDRTAIAMAAGGVTTMVLGTPPLAQLAAFAATLEPVSGGSAAGVGYLRSPSTVVVAGVCAGPNGFQPGPGAFEPVLADAGQLLAPLP